MGEINAQAWAAWWWPNATFNDALAMDRKLFGDGGPTIQALLQLGRFYSDEQIYPSSVASYREAFALLAKNPLARSQVVADQIVPFLDGGECLAERPRSRAPGRRNVHPPPR